MVREGGCKTGIYKSKAAVPRISLMARISRRKYGLALFF
jgi:hypothetical protein